MAPEDEIRELMTAYAAAFNRRDAVALSALYSEDGAIYSPYGPAAIGRDAIHAAHRDWLAEGEENKRLRIRDLRCDADMAFCVVEYAADYPQGDGTATTESGVSVNVLVRGSGGWQFQLSSLTADQT